MVGSRRFAGGPWFCSWSALVRWWSSADATRLVDSPFQTRSRLPSSERSARLAVVVLVVFAVAVIAWSIWWWCVSSLWCGWSPSSVVRYLFLQRDGRFSMLRLSNPSGGRLVGLLCFAGGTWSCFWFALVFWWSSADVARLVVALFQTQSWLPSSERLPRLAVAGLVVCAVAVIDWSGWWWCGGFLVSLLVPPLFVLVALGRVVGLVVVGLVVVPLVVIATSFRCSINS